MNYRLGVQREDDYRTTSDQRRRQVIPTPNFHPKFRCPPDRTHSLVPMRVACSPTRRDICYAMWCSKDEIIEGVVK